MLIQKVRLTWWRKRHTGWGFLILAVSVSVLLSANKVEAFDAFGETVYPYLEIEAISEHLRETSLDEGFDDSEWTLGVSATAGLFYSAHPRLDLYVEGIVSAERFWTEFDNDRDMEWSAERGETWLDWQVLADNNLYFKIGRQEFYDARTWWWDADLDALQLSYYGTDWGLSLALAKEAAPTSTLDDNIDPEAEDVTRALGSLSWNWTSDHYLEAFALHQNDLSGSHNLGDIVKPEREDEVDANLTWLGLRSAGDVFSDDYGQFTYWIDGAFVWGNETIFSFEEDDDEVNFTAEREHQNVRGWAIDLGIDWTLPVPSQPSFFFSYALGSGDDGADDDTDESFRQTGLQSNEGASPYYGALFNPELSNLRIITVGIAWPLFEDGSLGLFQHDYRQVEAAPFLRDAGIFRDPDGFNKDLGREWGLVYTFENDTGLYLQGIFSIFEADRAFGEADGDFAYRAYLDLVYTWD